MLVPIPQAIDPRAQALAETVSVTYRSLKTLRCTVVADFPDGCSRAEFTFARPGNVLVRKLRGDLSEVDTEYRLRGDRLIVSAPEDTRRYLRTRVAQRAGTPLGELAYRSQGSLDGLARLLDSRGRPFFDSRAIAAMSLGSPEIAADGTPVDVLNVTSTIDGWANGRNAVWTIRSAYQIGVEDHLIRREESLTEGPDERTRKTIDYEDVVANRPVPRESFAFHAGKGMAAVEQRRGTTAEEPRAEAILAASTQALQALDSLSFVAEWSREDGSGPTEERTFMWFDLRSALFGPKRTRLPRRTGRKPSRNRQRDLPHLSPGNERGQHHAGWRGRERRCAVWA